MQSIMSNPLGTVCSFESSEQCVAQCATKVCSFGERVVEKQEKAEGRMEGGGRHIYRFDAPLCEYMVGFIKRLHALPDRFQMNMVLENFTVLQVLLLTFYFPLPFLLYINAVPLLQIRIQFPLHLDFVSQQWEQLFPIQIFLFLAIFHLNYQKATDANIKF